jgi:hypothetical protein
MVMTPSSEPAESERRLRIIASLAVAAVLAFEIALWLGFFERSPGALFGS